MKMRSTDIPASEPRLVEAHDQPEEAKLEALRQAAHQGWTDVSAGRYADVEDYLLDAFVGQLGLRAAQRAKPTR